MRTPIPGGPVPAVVIGVVLVIALVVAALVGDRSDGGATGADDVDSFEDCAAAGYPIMESYPEQCRTPDGRLFVRVIDQ